MGQKPSRDNGALRARGRGGDRPRALNRRRHALFGHVREPTCRDLPMQALHSRSDVGAPALGRPTAWPRSRPRRAQEGNRNARRGLEGGSAPRGAVEVRVEDAHLGDAVDRQLVALRRTADRLGSRGVVDAEGLPSGRRSRTSEPRSHRRRCCGRPLRDRSLPPRRRRGSAGHPGRFARPGTAAFRLLSLREGRPTVGRARPGSQRLDHPDWADPLPILASALEPARAGRNH